jgi:predicted TIM-barrel fold metal-dependent hydrolase
VTRLWGEDALLLERAGAPVAELAALEAELEATLALPGRGGWWDAHVHLGRDRDGHRLAAEELRADLDRWGFAGAVCFPANDPGPDGQFGAANAAVLQAARRLPGRVVALCRLDPGRPWQAALERAAAGGARGLKLHPIAQRFRPEGPECIELVREAARRGWPVLIHAGFGARPLAEPLGRLAEAVPEARLILAHGGRGDARAIRDRVAALPGVLLDTSLATLPDLIDLPPERLCFGSDRPYGEHPSALQLVALAAALAGWSAAQTEAVMGGNLAQWLAAAA